MYKKREKKFSSFDFNPFFFFFYILLLFLDIIYLFHHVKEIQYNTIVTVVIV